MFWNRKISDVTCIFFFSSLQVEHFSKYKLETEDSEEDEGQGQGQGQGGEVKRSKVCPL